jgi:hypothetical protein
MANTISISYPFDLDWCHVIVALVDSFVVVPMDPTCSFQRKLVSADPAIP